MANTAASTLITRALDNASRAAAGTTRSGTTLENASLVFLNTVLQRISRRHDFREMIQLSSSVAGTSITVASTKTYTFPTDWKTILSIRIIDGTDSRKLIQIPRRRFDEGMPYPENETIRIPQWYVPYGNSFDLFPIPDTAYVMPIRYIKRPATIASTATLVDYEPTKDDLIVAGMTSEIFNHLQDFEDGAIWEAKFKTQLKEAILEDLDNWDWDPVGRGFESGYNNAYIGEYWNDPFVKHSL